MQYALLSLTCGLEKGQKERQNEGGNGLKPNRERVTEEKWGEGGKAKCQEDVERQKRGVSGVLSADEEGAAPALDNRKIKEARPLCSLDIAATTATIY